MNKVLKFNYTTPPSRLFVCFAILIFISLFAKLEFIKTHPNIFLIYYVYTARKIDKNI